MEISRECRREHLQFLLLIQHSFLTQYGVERSSGGNVLYLVLSSQNGLMANIKIHEPLVNIHHIQILVVIKVKSERTYTNTGETSTKVNIKI